MNYFSPKEHVVVNGPWGDMLARGGTAAARGLYPSMADSESPFAVTCRWTMALLFALVLWDGLHLLCEG